MSLTNKELPNTISSGTDIYSIKGFKKAFQLYDVVFIFRGSMLFQYKGIFGGFEFHRAIEMKEKEVDKYITEWSKSL